MGYGFQVDAQLEGVSTRKDGSLTLRFSTQEVSAKGAGLIMTAAKGAPFGSMRFAPENENDVPEVKSEASSKTPSQRLRAVLYRLWQQTGSEDPWETYYYTCMEKLINQIKARLD